MRLSFSKIFIGALAIFGFAARSSSALEPQRILLIYNTNFTADDDHDGVQDSLEVAQYYAAKRGVPPSNLIGFRYGTSETYGNYHDFYYEMVLPLRGFLNLVGPTSVDTLVFCYGTPFAVNVEPETGNNIRSIDNLLAGPGYLARFSVPNQNPNPYRANGPTFEDDFPHFVQADFPLNEFQAKHGREMYLVSRLDGPGGVLASLGLVDQASYGERYITPGDGFYNGTVYINTRFGYSDATLAADAAVHSGSYVDGTAVDKNIAFSEHYLPGTGYPMKWETSLGNIGQPDAHFSDGSPAPLAPNSLFYAGWYAQLPDDVFDLKPGSVYSDLYSFSMYNVRSPAGGTSLRAMEQGAAAVTGTIWEPYTSGCPRPNVLLYYMLKGYPFAEAVMLATQQLGWMTISLGDPLYSPFKTKTAVHDTQLPQLNVGYPIAQPGSVGGTEAVIASVRDTPEPDVVKMWIDYGLTDSYGNTSDSGLVYRRIQQINLSGLQNNSVYHYRLRLKDPTGNITTTGDFTFTTGTTAPAPMVTAVSPVSGPAAGGTSVTINGSNFQLGLSVLFGPRRASNIVVSPTSITAISPPGTGVVNLVVRNTDGQSATASGAFTYASEPGPVVVNPARSSPVNIINRNSTTLSVLGGSSDGESNLIYTWSVTGAAPGAVSFSVNGNNDAKTTVMSFDTSGSYTLKVRIRDRSDRWVESAVGIEVVFKPTIVQDAIATPNPTTTNTAALSVNAADRLGEPNLSYTWSVLPPAPGTVQFLHNRNNGAKNTVATFSRSGTYRLNVGVTNSLSESTNSVVSVQVNFSGSAPTIVSQPVATPNPISGQDFTVLSTLGTDDGGEPGLTYTWSLFSGPSTMTFSANGTNAAKTSTARVSAVGLYQVDLVVTDSAGLSVSKEFSVRFTSLSGTPPFTITAISPRSGPLAGGTRVTINGTSFPALVSVLIGANEATGVNVLSPTTITAITPAGPAGPQDVTVIAASSGDRAVLTGGFTYGQITLPPTITRVSPVSGPTTGGTSLTITGGNFLAGATVNVGAAAAPTIVFVSDSELRVITPPGAAGTVGVEVINPDGQRAALPNCFTYVVPTAAPTITSISPTSGPTGGGTVITITGTNFVNDTTVKLGVTSATEVVFVSATQLTAVTPAGSAGAVNVQAANPGGQIGTISNGFTYVAPVSSPTVAIEATANPNPVQGNQAALSVLGNDDAGEINLIYRWSISGTAPGPVIFSVNDSNRAKNTVATFAQSGHYDFNVLIINQAGLSIISRVSVVVIIPSPIADVPADHLLADVRVIPNPFLAGQGDGTVQFENLPNNSSIAIYDRTGSTVSKYSGLAGTFHWDLKNRNGDGVVSGSYLAVISGGGGERKIKLVVIK